MIKHRPVAISGLSLTMTGFSLWLIYARFGILRSLPNFEPGNGEIMINVSFISDISILTVSFIPLVLGLGLWRLLTWARAISVCLFGSMMIPSLLAAMNLIPDRSASLITNLAIALGCAIALIILIHPKNVKAFI